MKCPVDAIQKCMYVSILVVCWFHLILVNTGTLEYTLKA